MSQPLFFIPSDESRITIADVERVGLGALIEAASGVGLMLAEAPTSGPEESWGFFAWFDDGSLDAVPPSGPLDGSITWRRAVPDGARTAGRFFLGVRANSPPGPRDLARGAQLTGYEVRLADGREWVVPIAQYLPKRQTLDPETGREVRAVRADHHAFFEAALAYHELIQSHHGSSPRQLVAAVCEVEGGFDFAVAALAKNYRLTRDLVDMLGLLDDEALWWVIAATVGIPTVKQIESQKKTACASIPAG